MTALSTSLRYINFIASVTVPFFVENELVVELIHSLSGTQLRKPIFILYN